MKAVVFVSVLSMSAMRVCGSEEPPPPPATGAPVAVDVQAEVVVPEPAHGGHVVVVDDRPVEVVVQNDGEVHAWVVHPEPPPPGFQMVVHVHGHDGNVHPVQMTWNAEAGIYAGRLVEVRPAPGPVEVHVALGGRVHRGHIQRVRVVRPQFSVFVERPTVAVDVVVEVDEHHHRGRGIGHIRGRGRGHQRHHHDGHVEVRVRGPAPPPPPHFSVRVEGPAPPPPPHVGVRIEGHAPRPPAPHVRVRGEGRVRVGGDARVRVRRRH